MKALVAVITLALLALSLPGCGLFNGSTNPCPSFRMSVIFYGSDLNPDGTLVYVYGVDFSADGTAATLTTTPSLIIAPFITQTP